MEKIGFELKKEVSAARSHVGLGRLGAIFSTLRFVRLFNLRVTLCMRWSSACDGSRQLSLVTLFPLSSSISLCICVFATSSFIRRSIFSSCASSAVVSLLLYLCCCISSPYPFFHSDLCHSGTHPGTHLHRHTHSLHIWVDAKFSIETDDSAFQFSL